MMEHLNQILSGFVGVLCLVPWKYLAVLAWEYWLGSTKLVKSNSTVELLMSVLKKEK